VTYVPSLLDPKGQGQSVCTLCALSDRMLAANH